MTELRIKVDEALLEILRGLPEPIERQALELMVLELYRRHTISAGRAAEILGKDKVSFIQWSGKLGIPYFDLSAEELQAELKTFEQSRPPA